MMNTMLGFVVRMKRLNVCHIGSVDSLPHPLSFGEEHEALLRKNGGDIEARNTLVEHNLRLVAYIARKYENSGIGVEDRISIGMIGLIKAVNSFNIEKGVRLAAYASRCVENEILMALRRSSRRREVSFDAPINTDLEGNEILLSDTLATDADLVSRDLDDIDYRQMLHGGIQKLNHREKKIVDLRFGLHDGFARTQKEVAEIMGISQSYVSRLEKQTYKKLKTALLS